MPNTAPTEPLSEGVAAVRDAAKETVKARPKPATRRPAAREKPLRVRIQLALRTLHVYTSMAALLMILSFALSGLLLNHPEWLPSGLEKSRDYQGQVNKAWLGNDEGKNTNWLQLAEQIRADHDLRGRVGDTQNDGEEASFSFQAPGRDTTVTITDKTGHYEVHETTQGLLNLIGDLHKGHNTGPGWKRVIDLTAIFLVLVSASGFGILLYLKKLRRPALITLAVGALLALAAVWKLAL